MIAAVVAPILLGLELIGIALLWVVGLIVDEIIGGLFERGVWYALRPFRRLLRPLRKLIRPVRRLTRPISSAARRFFERWSSPLVPTSIWITAIAAMIMSPRIGFTAQDPLAGWLAVTAVVGAPLLALLATHLWATSSNVNWEPPEGGSDVKAKK